MNPMLGFAPYILFAVLMPVSTDLALWAAFSSAFGLGIYTFLHTRSLRILDAGGAGLFGALAFYTGFIQPSLSIAHVHLAVDAGMFGIALVSLALRNAFALPHRNKDMRQLDGGRLCADALVISVWTAAFGFMATLDIISSIYKKLPFSLNIALNLVILVGVVIFTARYPARTSEKIENNKPVDKSRTID